jgi:plasmid stability protein
MGDLLIRHLPDDLHTRLRERARRNRRSLNAETLILIEQALAADARPERRRPVPYHGAFAIHDEWLDEAIRRGRL